MNQSIYREVQGWGAGTWALFAGFGLVVLLALLSAWTMEHNGHYVTGMNNQIVWGLPHVFAVFLIVAASGAINVASMASVFGRTPYKPLARLSGLVGAALLIGGLAVLVLDLGRPDRLIVAMTTYNFKSIFAWNIYLYVGFLAVIAVYLWFQMEWRMGRYVAVAGWVAFIWRLVLTTGTGSIFGFLVAREAYDSALMAPLFIAMSFSFGLAVFALVLAVACAGSGRDIGNFIVERFRRLLGIFIAAVLYFAAVRHLTNLYASEHIGVEHFLLLSGGVHTALFWLGQVGVGGVLPLVLLYAPIDIGARMRLLWSSAAVVLGGLAHVYVIIIGGQSYPLSLFPGMEVRSSFHDGAVASYAPSWPEVGLGIGGFAIAGLIVAAGIKALRFLPESLGDRVTDPHYRPPAAVAAE